MAELVVRKPSTSHEASGDGEVERRRSFQILLIEMGLWSRNRQELLMGEFRLTILNVLNSCKYSRIFSYHLVQDFSQSTEVQAVSFSSIFVGFSKSMKEMHFLFDNVSFSKPSIHWPENGSQKDPP